MSQAGSSKAGRRRFLSSGAFRVAFARDSGRSSKTCQARAKSCRLQMSLVARWLCRHRTMSATFRSSVRAWKGMLEQIDFTRRSFRDGWKDVLLPYRHPNAHDGCANFWVVDPQLGSDNWGPIYFCCHDAPVMLFEAAPLQQFVWAKRSKNTPRGTRVCIQARHRKHLTRACRLRTAIPERLSDRGSAGRTSARFSVLLGIGGSAV